MRGHLGFRIGSKSRLLINDEFAAMHLNPRPRASFRGPLPTLIL